MLLLTIDSNAVQDSTGLNSGFGSDVPELEQRNADHQLTAAKLNDLLQSSSAVSLRRSSDRSSFVLQSPDRDILQTIAPQLTPQKNAAKNRRARRSRRIKVKRIGVVKRHRGFGAVNVLAAANATQAKASRPGEHKPHKRQHRKLKMSIDAMSGLPQATFNQISAEMLFGAPHDIAAGWDGTLSAIDPSGAHHLYDSIGDAWNPFDEGIDAIAFDWTNKVLYCFRGSQFITINTVNNQTSPPTEIAAQWTNLPHSFTQRVTGATFASNGKFYLFNGGRYVPTDGSAPPVNLTDWSTWPVNDPTFGSGVIDGVVAEYVSGGILVLRGNQGLAIDLVNRAILEDSAPLSKWHNLGQVLPQDWLSSGIDTGVWTDVNTVQLFKGPAMLTVNNGETSPGTPFYIPTFSLFSNWTNTWHPRLVQAPSGRIGSLWSVDGQNNVYHHDGTAWSVIEGWAATSISVGQDGTTVYLSPAGGDVTNVWQVANTTSQLFSKFPGQAVQILVGNAEQIWIRDNNNKVYQYNSQQKSWNAFDLEASPTATAVAADGTLWHNDSQGNTYRFLAGASSKPVAGITNVQKLTTTGYGSVHCLVQQDGLTQQGNTQLYRYDSPYVFKSPQGYQISENTSIVQGLGNLYMIVAYQDIYHQDHSYVAAVDAHTGQEISRTEDLGLGDLDAGGYSPYYTGVIFDPINELVYLTSFSGAAVGSTVTAVDARNLKNAIWHFTTDIIDNPPALSGTQLCFGDRNGTLYLFNTSAALQTANQSKDSNPNLSPQACGGWQQTISKGGIQAPLRISTPVFASSPYGQINALVVFDFQGGTGQALVQCDPHNPSNVTGRIFQIRPGEVIVPEQSPAPFSPIVVGQALFKDNSTQPALIHSDLLGTSVIALPYTLTGEDNFLENILFFKIPGGKYLQTAIGYDPGASSSDASVWFADTGGTLWGLNSQLKSVNQYHATGDDSDAIVATTPFIYKTTAPGSQNTGQTETKPVVFFGITSPNTDFAWNSLFLYDPVSGNQFSVETGVTEISALSTSLNNGVLYAGGNYVTKFSPSDVWCQLFGIRLNELVQGLRDFIIESQLMQDPDDDPSLKNGNKDQNIPPSVARYQTHLTVVDDLKAPRINEAVKIWADQPNTQVIVNGQSYTIGPDDNPTPAGQSPLPGQTGYSYASVKTGSDGALVIVSKAGNVNTSMLRVWATFMDPYERVLVFPDHEFHGRVSNSYDSSSSTSADSYTDPDHPDLSSVGNYSGNSLFSDDDKKAGQPKQVANATQQMRQGVGPGGSTQVQLGKVLTALRSTDPNTPYVPYEDLTGMHYAPNNAIASRPAQINQAMGLKFALANPDGSYDPNSNTFSHTAIDHADARTAIDNLEGTPWSPTEVGLPFEGRRVGNAFTDFWNWLVSGIDKIAAEIKQVIVSVAEDIAVGLQYIWNQVKKVFKAIIKVVEDIAHAVASFFVALAKLIMDIIEALSVLFHFGEILKTQKWLAGQVTTQVERLKTLIQQKVIPNIDNFFQNGEAGVKQTFDQLRSKLTQNFGTSPLPPNTNQLPGSGATSHTTFKAGSGSVGPNSSGSSRSVHCSWSLQKTKHGLPGSGITSSTTQAADISISDFINTFIQRLSNGDLSSAFSQLKTDFTNLFSSCSVSTFFDNLLITLLDMIETLLLAALDIAQAFVDGMMSIISQVIDEIMNAITSHIEIPLLSWLYFQITGEKLSILNLVTLVAAIPVTILYRVVEGKYPSQSFEEASEETATMGQAEINPPLPVWAQCLLGVSAGISTIVAGFVNGVVDCYGSESPPKALPYVATALGLVIVVITGPELTYSDANNPPDNTDWAAYGISIVGLVLGVFGLPSVDIQGEGAYVLVFLTVITSLASLFAAIIVYLEDHPSPTSDDNASLTAGIFGSFPGLINYLKLDGPEAAAVVGVIDVLAGAIAGLIGLVEGFKVIEASLSLIDIPAMTD